MSEAEKERAAVVAWLWKSASEDNDMANAFGAARNWEAAIEATKSAEGKRRIAHAIEHGEHLTDKGGE